ncbi:MAG TPA: hypothetical protein DDZ84_01595 [Firmicutes bacterium]|nr:hypothetical protein [Bacillota bacterium]
MRFNAVRAIALVSIVLVFLFGFGFVGCMAEEAAVPAPGEACVQQACRCEPITAIVGCGECTKCDERNIQLCPPARVPQTPTIVKTLVVDLVQVQNGRVIVFAHVDKLITYVDVNGVTRNRLVRVPFTCDIPIEGIVFTDTVAFQSIVITEETDTLCGDGRILIERLCVRINVSIQRIIGCRLICPDLR